jgi:MTH538 TIR-like domain (DUF1863)
MPTYNIFISHSWTYSDTYDQLIELLHTRDDFQFKDFSVPKDDPIHNSPNEQALYRAIYNHIRPASVVLIMAGVYATHSKWINHEIQIAKRGFQSPKPIIAIKPWAQTNVSTVARQNADVLVGWNTKSVVAAIHKWG